MKTTLYYFTGTGNSLWFAKQLQSHIAECEIRSIAKAIDKDDLTIPEGRVGIVTPLYFCGLPEIVMRFIKESDLSKAEYIFIAFTHGGPAFVEGGGVEQTESLLAQKGIKLNASFLQWMPGNSILWYGAHPGFVHRFQLASRAPGAEDRSHRVERRQPPRARQPPDHQNGRSEGISKVAERAPRGR